MTSFKQRSFDVWREIRGVLPEEIALVDRSSEELMQFIFNLQTTIQGNLYGKSIAVSALDPTPLTSARRLAKKAHEILVLELPI